jgi:uncharacterized protein (TIGR02246 family)
VKSDHAGQTPWSTSLKPKELTVRSLINHSTQEKTAMKSIFLAALACGALAACADTPEVTAVDSKSASLTSPRASIGDAAEPSPGIAELKSAWDAAWAAKDAAAYAANYAADADFVGPRGPILAGREAIRAQHVFLFNGPFAGSTQTSVVRRTVFLGGAVRMVDLEVALTGYATLPPGLPETEPGVVRTRVKWIVVRRHGDWEILAQQMTQRLPNTP